MNFSEQFIQIMDEVSKKFGVTVDWTSKNVMPYVNDLFSRFVKYEVYTSIAWIVLGTILLIAGVLVARWLFKNDEYGTNGGYICLGVAVSIIGVLTITQQTFDIIQVKTIPEKTAIEYIQYLKSND